MIDKIYCIDGLSGMQSLPRECIPLTVTSPPYDGLRNYGGHLFNWNSFQAFADELWRVTMPGGLVVWIVADEIKKSHSGTSFRQALYFQELGFRIHDVIILTRSGGRWCGGNRYGRVNYAFVFSKSRPRCANIIRDKPNKHAGVLRRFRARLKNGELKQSPRAKPVAEMGIRGSVWECHAGFGKTTRDLYAYGHPSLMPEDIAGDLIRSWSRPGDLVLDPFMGSGTTAKMALLNHRHYLGYEVHEPYFQISLRRMQDAHIEYRNQLDNWLLESPRLTKAC